jgi:hypothetical protein
MGSFAHNTAAFLSSQLPFYTGCCLSQFGTHVLSPSPGFADGDDPVYSDSGRSMQLYRSSNESTE